MTSPSIKIRVWWLNRAVVYLIPLIFVFLLIVEIARHEYGGIFKGVFIITLILIFFEHVALSFKVDLFPGQLNYAQGLFPFKKQMSIDINSIASVSFLPLPIFGMQSARLAVSTHGGDIFVLSLAAFRPQDIKKILNWLPVEPASKPGSECN